MIERRTRRREQDRTEPDAGTGSDNAAGPAVASDPPLARRRGAYSLQRPDTARVTPVRLSRLRRWLVPVAAALVVLAAGNLAEDGIADYQRRQMEATVLGQLATLRARLEGGIWANLLLSQGMAAHVALNPDLDQAAFERFAAELTRQPNQLRNIAAARDLVVSHMYPLAGNEAAIGLDYTKLPKQREAAQRAASGTSMVIAGPLKLVQGGTGLIGRTPVFTSSDDHADARPRLWGLVAAVIDLDALFQANGVPEFTRKCELAIRGVDGKGADGAVFYGDPALFDGDPVLTEVRLPGGRWQMAARPLGGWGANRAATNLLEAATLVLALLAALLSHLSLRHWQQREQAFADADESRRRLIDAIESMSEGFVLWGPDDRLLLCNSHFHELFPHLQPPLEPGITFEEMLRRSLAPNGKQIDAEGEAWIAQRLRAHRTGLMDEEERPGDERIIARSEYTTADGGTLALYTDVTAIRRAEQDIRFRAFFDPLTGLPNRAYFLDQLGTEIARTRRSGGMLALMFVDLDRFKNVNDSLGHGVGDELLQQAAERIRRCVRSSDLVARLGGDEFTVMLPDVGAELAPHVVAEAIIERLAEPYVLGSHQVYSAASIGITLFPRDADDTDTLLKNADMAMYQAKDMGRGNYQFFTPDLTARAHRFVSLERDLRRAVEARELSVAFQPIVALPSGRVVGAEALARWRRADGSSVSPAEFIPVAEESGIIAELGHQVLDLACREAAIWPALVATPPYLAVNLSARELKNGLDAAQVKLALAASAYPPTRLVFEITESVLLDHDERILTALESFRRLGIGIALDDFGTGFSSLSYLRRFPVTTIKIDCSFVRDMARDENDARPVESLLAMGDTLRMQVVAEGVEGATEADMLTRMGCRFAQGYHLGMPQSPAEFAALLATHGGDTSNDDDRQQLG